MHKSKKTLTRHGSGPVAVRIVAYHRGKIDVHHFDRKSEADDFEAILKVKYFEPVDVLKFGHHRPRVFDRLDFSSKPITNSVDLRFCELQLKMLRGVTSHGQL